MRRGAIVSLVALEEGTRVRTRGLAYALDDAPLRNPTHGLGNVATCARPSVAVVAGRLLLCAEGGTPWPTR